MDRKSSTGFGLLLAAILVLATGHPMEAAAYIKMGDIKGEATDNEHKDWIIIESMSTTMNVAPPGSAGTSATRRRGDVHLDDITVSKSADAASPKIAEAVCLGKVFPKVEIELTASYTGEQTYYRYELKNVMVTSYSVNAGGSDRPVENFTLNFEEVKVHYDEVGMRSKGKGGNAETTWKVEKGEK